MQYKLEFEIAAFILLIVILLHFHLVRQFPTRKARVFLAFTWVSFIECFFNIASAIGLANAQFVPQMVNELLAFAFFVAEGASAFLLFGYVYTICAFEGQQRKRIRIAGTIPFVLFEIGVLLTPFIGFFFYMEDNCYYQGFGANFGYFYIGYYFILNLLMVLLQRNRVPARLKTVFLCYSIFAIFAMHIQIMNREIMLTSAGNALIIFLFYLSMQNPGELLDTITGVGNGNALKVLLAQKIEEEKPLATYSIEIKNFHQLQTLFGEENSEMLLGEIGKYLVNLSGRFHVFHRRDESFDVIFDQEQDKESLLGTLQERFADVWRIHSNYIMVDVIITHQHYPNDFKDLPEFLGMHEYLLEQAREQGLHVIENNEELIGQYHRRKQVELALQKAVEERSLLVYFQPIYSLQEKRIVSLEALTRMRDEQLGFIPPDEFIPLAEKSGSIIQIGEIVLEACCRFLSKHILSNDSLGIRTIQVNISGAQCMQQNLKGTILPILEKYHIPPTMITLEVTESMAIQAPELMQRHMEELGKLGIEFAADDYGTGNSNFSSLVKFPFREIKIDKDMTWAYFENETAHVILENEIQTMKRLGLPVVVEGIETKEQSDAMEELGVNYIQGYFYGRPMPEKECLVYIRKFNDERDNYGR